MTNEGQIWLGADPGGKGNFGAAILGPGNVTHTYCVDCADDAVEVLVENLPFPPSGMGVDAPLWWSSGRSGDRRADQWLRETYSLSGGQVQTANSLRGAALTQAAMFIQRMRERYSGLPVTEAHPKALIAVVGCADWEAFSQRFSVEGNVDNEHKRDAIVAAVAAREGFQGRWTRDLSCSRLPSEQDPSRYWLAPVHYFWPET